MPFNMFKAFSGSCSRKNRNDRAALGVFTEEHVFEQDYRRNLLRRTTTTKVPPAPAHDVAANASAQALELALGMLSERLSLACASPRLLDPSSVAETADAIGKVAQASTQVNHLRQRAATESSLIS